MEPRIQYAQTEDGVNIASPDEALRAPLAGGRLMEPQRPCASAWGRRRGQELVTDKLLKIDLTEGHLGGSVTLRDMPQGLRR